MLLTHFHIKESKTAQLLHNTQASGGGNRSILEPKEVTDWPMRAAATLCFKTFACIMRGHGVTACGVPNAARSMHHTPAESKKLLHDLSTVLLAVSGQ